MRIILMAAGVGERLWPMSTEEKPKQFLPLFPHPRDPERTASMIQRVYDHLESLGLKEKVSVVTTRDVSGWVSEQLGAVPQHILPYRKDTFASVAFAALDVARRFKMHSSETFLFLPVDHWVEEDFYVKAVDLERLLQYESDGIALLGVKPTEAASSYGYMEIKPKGSRNYYQVYRFREKPSLQEAKELIDRSLWNAGVFAFRLETAEKIIPFFEVMRKVAMDYWAVTKWFESLSEQSFDREVLEHHSSILASPFMGVWEDVGTWDRAMKYIPTQILGEGDVVECSNVHVVNALPQPVIVAGLDDVAVVATEQGIIVTKKSMAPNMKELRGVTKVSC